jgi:hypothetical protein
MGCDACAIGVGACDCNRPIYKTLIDGCGRPFTYCKKAWLMLGKDKE